MVDITKKAPDKKEKNFKNSLIDFLFYLVQWTWGLPVNLVGGIAFLICTKIKKRRWQRFGYSYIVYLPWKSGGLSLGLFIFMKEGHKNKKWTYNTRIHEYGHTWQCLLLGPLYYIVIAVPSMIFTFRPPDTYSPSGRPAAHSESLIIIILSEPKSL